MAWDDPSPLKRARPPMANSLAGAANPGGNKSFGDLVVFVLVALIAGGLAYEGVHAFTVKVVDPAARHAVLDIAVPLLVAAIVAFLVLRFAVRTPSSAGGYREGGWFGRRRWNDFGNDDRTFGQRVADEVAADLVGEAIDAALD